VFFKKFKYIIYSFSELLLVITHPLIGILISPLPKYFGKTISKDAPTVVIVERWMNSNIFHNFWKYYLEKKDLNVYLVSLRLQKGNFDESAQELKKFIDTENLENMILVGISGGGISAYLYLQNYDGWRKVKNFISIGTPFRGSSLIFPLSLFIYSAEELLPESKLIKKIKKEKVKKRTE
jgi:pimeloyl-ACP methyl ester carboxylesterase